MRASKRVRSVIAATAVTIGSMACSTPPPKTVLTEADVAKASAVDQVHMLERQYLAFREARAKRPDDMPRTGSPR